MYIPEKVQLQPQVMPGLEKRYVIPMLRFGLPGLGGGFCALFFLEDAAKSLLLFIFGMVWFAACLGLFMKEEGESSIYEYFSKMIVYQRSQKKYFYKHEEETIYDVRKEEII